MENKIIIEIGENKLGKIKIQTAGGIESKFVTIEEIAQMFLASNELQNTVEEEFIETPILPQYHDISTIQYLESVNTQIYVLKKEAGNIDMTYFGDKFVNVGFPTLIFKIKISNNSIKSIQLVATKDNIITSNTAIFKYPFSNVFENTNVCLGANNIASLDVSNTHTIFRIPNLVLSLENNNDAYIGSNNSGLQLRELFSKLQNHKFNKDWLIPSPMQSYKQWLLK